MTPHLSFALDAFASGIFLGLVGGLCLGVVLGFALALSSHKVNRS